MSAFIRLLEPEQSDNIVSCLFLLFLLEVMMASSTPFSVASVDPFHPGLTSLYEYDFGTTTELRLRVLAEEAREAALGVHSNPHDKPLSESWQNLPCRVLSSDTSS